MRFSFLPSVLGLLLLAGSAGQAFGADKTARDLLPASVAGYVEVPRPDKTLGVVVDHPLAKQLQQTPDFQAALQKPQYRRFQAGVKLVEEKFGMPWRPALEAVTSGGIYLGFDLPTQGTVALVHATDEATAAKGQESILALIRAAAAEKGNPDPVAAEEMRGVQVQRIGDVHLAAVGNWLVLANKRLLMFMLLENYQTDSMSLADDEQFQTAWKDRGEAAAWAYLDLRVIRELGVMRPAFSKKSDNPALELLAGGVIGVLPEAPYVSAALELDAKRVQLRATLPGDPKSVAKVREFYFGPEGRGTAPALLRPERTLLSLSAYRDFASLWSNAPDLFNDEINAKFAEAESGLTTFFAGRNFRDEILGNLEPGLQLVVTRQEFPADGITPAVKLPAGAAVLRMKNPEETTRIFKITFQSAMGFLNVVGGMNGVPPLDLNNQTDGDVLVVSTEYLPPTKNESRTEAGIHYNASPTVAFVGDKFILASTKKLALELADHVQRDANAKADVNAQLVVDGKVGQAALADNRDTLIAQNMLEKGHGRAAAEKEIDGVLKLLENVEQLSARLTTADRQIQLTLELNLSANNHP